MKRIIWVSVLLTLAGLLLPLAFMVGGAEYKGDSVLDSPGPEPTAAASPSPSPTPEPTPSYSRDEAFVFTLKHGETVSEISMAEYLPRAVAAEMPHEFHGEALRAQAVAARTYVLYCTRHENPKHPEADVCSDYGCCLAYLDEEVIRANWGEEYEANMAIISAACTETDGQIVTYEAQAILATFHSSSAGQTEDGAELWGDVPYLESVASPETAEDVPNYVSTVEVSPENLRDSVRLLYPEAAFSGDSALWVEGIENDESGRVRSVTICGIVLTGSEMRKLFSLRSTAFTLEYNGTAFIFTVTGFGHGLGMSQYGANVMAENGSGYREILAHYYPNTVIT
jgi:stage II sporulation protein D